MWTYGIERVIREHETDIVEMTEVAPGVSVTRQVWQFRATVELYPSHIADIIHTSAERIMYMDVSSSNRNISVLLGDRLLAEGIRQQVTISFDNPVLEQRVGGKVVDAVRTPRGTILFEVR